MRLSTICCIGGDHVGGPACSVIALKCPEIRVTVLDQDSIISQWNSDTLPFYEPDLDDIVKKCRNRNLFFSTDYSNTIREADLIFISINSPTKTRGAGEGKTVDLKEVEDAARMIGLYGESDKIVVEKSTVPARAAERITMILHSARRPGVRYQVLSNPEFTTEGSAISDLLQPERVLIGCPNNPGGRAAAESLCTIYEHWIPRKNIIVLNTWSAELTKLAANAFLAQRISSINSIAEICEETEADISEISAILRRDSRIGSKYLSASLGFGGFQKEILSLIYMCECLKLPEIASYWQAVLDMNNHQKARFIGRIKSILDPVGQKVIAVWGFSYKKDTCDTKNSPAIEVCKWLLSEGAQIQIYDPKVQKKRIQKDLKISNFNNNGDKNVIVCNNPYEACEKAHAVIVCTEWDEFTKVDYSKVQERMKKPLMIDGRKFLNPEVLKKFQFEFHTIGLSET